MENEFEQLLKKYKENLSIDDFYKGLIFCSKLLGDYIPYYKDKLRMEEIRDKLKKDNLIKEELKNILDSIELKNTYEKYEEYGKREYSATYEINYNNKNNQFSYEYIGRYDDSYKGGIDKSLYIRINDKVIFSSSYNCPEKEKKNAIKKLNKSLGLQNVSDKEIVDFLIKVCDCYEVNEIYFTV